MVVLAYLSKFLGPRKNRKLEDWIPAQALRLAPSNFQALTIRSAAIGVSSYGASRPFGIGSGFCPCRRPLQGAKLHAPNPWP